MELHEFTYAQIKNEYLRRKRLRNAEWYYIPRDEDPDPEWRADNPEFLFVHRRMWHLTKAVHRVGVNKRFLTMPKGFREMGFAYFRYQPNTKPHKPQDPVKLLEDYHFVRLPQPFDSKLYTSVQTFSVPMTNGAKLHANWISDTPELKAIVDDWIQSQPKLYDDGFEEHRTEAERFAAENGCVAYSYNNYGSHTHIAFLKKEVFESLPPHPFKLRPGQEIP